MYSGQFVHAVLFVIGIITSGSQSVDDKTKVSNDYYIESERKANWFQAFNNCSVKHMNLIILDTKEKTEALTAELRKVFGSNHPNIWIGGNDNKKDREFIWMSSNQPFGYTNWAPGQPDNKNAIEHCVMLWEGHNYHWNDGNCLAKVPYVCEKRR